MPGSAHNELWPELPYEAWKDTRETLHLWTQHAYPVPKGFGRYAVKPQAAFFHEGLGEFLLPYDAVRTALDQDAALLSFLESTYEAAANLAHWDRAALECPLGVPGVPRAAKAA